jgi:hypothetical protein
MIKWKFHIKVKVESHSEKKVFNCFDSFHKNPSPKKINVKIYIKEITYIYKLKRLNLNKNVW